MTLRILIVSQYFWPEQSPINDLAEGLVDRGHAVAALTGMPNALSGRFVEGYGGWRTRRENRGGITIWRVPIVPRGAQGRLLLPLNYVSFWISGSVLGPSLVEGAFDIIFVWQPSPITVAFPAIRLKRRLGVPLVMWVQDLWPESLSAAGGTTSPLVLDAVGVMVRSIYRHCDKILIESPRFCEHIMGKGVDPERISYVPNWAEKCYHPVERASGAPEDEELPKGFRLIYAGTIGAAHDFPTLLTAAELLRHRSDIQWIIIGDGRNRWLVEDEIVRRGLQATFHLIGRRPSELIPRYAAFADALLMSLRNRPLFSLTIPSKLQAYLACGRPVIAAINGVVAEIIADAGAGLCAEASNPRQLAERVEDMAALSSAEREAMGARARNYYLRNFDRAATMSLVEGHMQELLERSAPLDAARVSAYLPRS
jgi:colanic acid biosynthesis glycosyl transferase WcaI